MSPCLRALEELQRAGEWIAVGMTMLPWGFGSFFSTETQWLARLVYASMTATLLVYSLFAIFSGMLIPECDRPPPAHHIAHSNSDYPVDYCRWRRYASVGYLSVWECDMCRRVLASIICGSITGWERRRADRPAGIRTMAMVCLGACVFTIDSMFAFLDGPMSWDASRVSAAIPSGVGFLGAASIWKNTAKESGAAPEVHGLTTATSVWLSAAIGILCGGALYVPAVFSTFASVVFLRFAPRTSDFHADGLIAPLSEIKPTDDESRAFLLTQPLLGTQEISRAPSARTLHEAGEVSRAVSREASEPMAATPERSAALLHRHRTTPSLRS